MDTTKNQGIIITAKEVNFQLKLEVITGKFLDFVFDLACQGE